MKLRNTSKWGIACLSLAAATAVGADEALDAEWSTRLLQQKALAERAQQDLDARKVAYAKAVASGAAETEVRARAEARDAAAAELASLEQALPEMIRAAREAGVSDTVLQPYRFAVQPPDDEAPAATPE